MTLDEQPAQLTRLVALYNEKNFPAALALAQELTDVWPHLPTPLQVRGAILDQLRKFPEALECKERALALDRQNPTAWSNLGNTLNKMGRNQDAIHAYKAAISLKADYADAWSNLGNALNDSGQFEEAERILVNALKLAPSSASTARNYGNALRGLGRLDDALRAYSRSVEIDPLYGPGYTNLAAVMFDLDRFDEAIDNGRKAVQLEPHSATAFGNLGNALLEAELLDDAEEALGRAIALDDTVAENHFNLANVYFAKAKYGEALSYYDSALTLKQEHKEARLNRCMLQLSLGRYSGAIADYNLRFEVNKNTVLPNLFRPKPNDRRPDLRGKRIAVHWEQGLGDTIQFFRFLPQLSAVSEETLFYSQPKLAALLASSTEPVTVSKSEPDAGIGKRFDLFLPLMSLPWALGLDLAAIPLSTGYLRADPIRVAYWRESLPQKAGLRVGLCWQGSTAKIDRGRSIPLALFSVIAKMHDIQLVSLHKGAGENQIQEFAKEHRLVTLGDDFDTGPDAFLDTAAVIENCDVVITTDTAIAHLAGAMGAPTWILLKHVPDWRWGVAGTTTPWYKTARLFRQNSLGNWADPLQRVAEELRSLLKSR